MNKTVCVTIVKTIELTDEEFISMSDEELSREFGDLCSLDGWNWDDESHTVEIFNTKDVVLGDVK